MLKTPTSRRNLLGVLVVIFGIQTGMVYLDAEGRRTPPLSELAITGQKIWHQNNCQSCHQRFGFGGFLGPDLTNAMSRLPREQLDAVLTKGTSPMPAFNLSEDEIDAIEAYLLEIDQTGTGQFQLAIVPPATELLDGVVETVASAQPLGPAAAAGFETMQSKKCITCHLPNPRSSVQAPDLCGVIETPGEEGVRTTINEGRILRGMPSFSLTDDEQDNLIAFLEWLHAHTTDIHEGFAPVGDHDDSGIPWFEYER